MTAGLEGRSELKYALPVTRRGEVLQAASGFVAPGQNTRSLAKPLGRLPEDLDFPAYGYRVHSMYLDSPLLDGYARRLREANIRNRVRIRTYGKPRQDRPVFLEAKRKLREHVVKHRVLVGGSHAWSQGDPVEPWVDAIERLSPGYERHLGDRWLAAARSEAPIPFCVTHYLREVYEDGQTRLTLDHHVRGSRVRDPRRFKGAGEVALLPPDWMVLELKFNGTMPGWMRRLLRDLRLISEPVSKFALAMVRTVRDDRRLELEYLTPPSILHAGQSFASPREHLVGVAR